MTSMFSSQINEWETQGHGKAYGCALEDLCPERNGFH